MATRPLNTIKNWFKTGLKPNQDQFWDTWDSFFHKEEKIPITAVDSLETIINNKIGIPELNVHKNDNNAHGIADKLAKKVDKKQGYNLSKNDFTTELKNKLVSVEAGAQVNIPINWDNIKDRPEVFPPSTHKHTIEETQGLKEALEHQTYTPITHTVIKELFGKGWCISETKNAFVVYNVRITCIAINSKGSHQGVDLKYSIDNGVNWIKESEVTLSVIPENSQVEISQTMLLTAYIPAGALVKLQAWSKGESRGRSVFVSGRETY